MQDINLLKQIKIMQSFDDSTLEKIFNIASIENFKTGDFLYKERQEAQKIFSIIEGNVCIDIQKDSTKVCRVEDLFKGNTTGISSLFGDNDKKYLFSAYVLAPTKVFTWKAEELEKLFNEDALVGFTFMKGIARILMRRLSIKNIQCIDIYQ